MGSPQLTAGAHPSPGHAAIDPGVGTRLEHDRGKQFTAPED